MGLEPPDFEKYRKYKEELAQIVSVKEGHIVVNVHYEYNIPLTTCNTYEKILSWAFQLTEKTWMSTDIVRRFIVVACNESGLAIPHS